MMNNLFSTKWQLFLQVGSIYIDKRYNIQSKEMVLTTYPEVGNDTLQRIVILQIVITCSLSFDILCISGCACRTEEFFKWHKHFVNFGVFSIAGRKRFISREEPASAAGGATSSASQHHGTTPTATKTTKAATLPANTCK